MSDQETALLHLQQTIRELLDVSRFAKPTRTAAQHRQVVVKALPILLGGISSIYEADVLLHGDVIDAVLVEEGL